uniref:Floral homeotic protein DEFICIENS n=1 Tax=Nicotiana tabacum TaxID=4097 RepID=A0A1S4AFL9_TOBAC|nr:PREDICTED: floral homeotic protein DEFICIENS-like [Nicotiana tabacum]
MTGSDNSVESEKTANQMLKEALEKMEKMRLEMNEMQIVLARAQKGQELPVTPTLQPDRQIMRLATFCVSGKIAIVVKWLMVASVHRQRTGEDMSGLSLQELCHLQENISESLDEIRERKYHVIKTQTDTCRKKVKNLEKRHGNLVLDLEAKSEDPKYGVVENEGQYNSAMAFANGVHNLYAFRLQSLHPNLQNGGEFGSRNLRLA